LSAADGREAAVHILAGTQIDSCGCFPDYPIFAGMSGLERTTCTLLQAFIIQTAFTMSFFF